MLWGLKGANHSEMLRMDLLILDARKVSIRTKEGLNRKFKLQKVINKLSRWEQQGQALKMSMSLNISSRY